MRRFLVVLGILLIPLVSFGQFVNTPPQLSLSTSPVYPGPHEEVRVKLTSSSIDLRFATITWTVDGAAYESGQGITEITLTTGAMGSSHTVTASVRSAEKSGDVSTTISTGEVDLLWEAETVTPSFYEGKALLSNRAQARIIAVPQVYSQNGVQYNPQDLYYTWRFNGRTINDRSGRGRFSFLGDSSAYENRISVTVASPSGENLASNTILIPRTTPILLVYVNHVLYGPLYNRALSGTATFDDDFLDLVAEPFYFTNTTGTDADITWGMRGATGAESNGQFLTFGKERGTEARVVITAEAESPVTPLQRASKALTVLLR